MYRYFSPGGGDSNFLPNKRGFLAGPVTLFWSRFEDTNDKCNRLSTVEVSNLTGLLVFGAVLTINFETVSLDEHDVSAKQLRNSLYHKLYFICFRSFFAKF